MLSIESQSSEDDAFDRPSRRWTPSSTLPRVNCSEIADIRLRYKIPASVEIDLHDNLFAPVNDDEVAVSLYQLESGLSMPIDQGLCTILTNWKITLPQVHPSLFLAIRRLFLIAHVFHRLLLPSDIQRIITPCGNGDFNGAKKFFNCRWRVEKRCLVGFPSSYRNWESPCFKFRHWQGAHNLDIPRALAFDASTPSRNVNCSQLDLESDARIQRLFDLPPILFDVSFPDCIVQWTYRHEKNHGRLSDPIVVVPFSQIPLPRDPGLLSNVEPSSKKRHPTSSSSPSFPRARKKRHQASLNNHTPVTSTLEPRNGKQFRRLRKAYQNQYQPDMNRGTGPLTTNMIRIPDAMSENICYQHRRSERLRNKDYVFTEESMCASTSGFAPSLNEFGGNKESSDSGPSDEIPGAESESAEDVSSGGSPSSCREVYAEQVPMGREAMRGNDFSNTIFVDDCPPSKNNVSTARDDDITPGHSQPACDSGGGTVQSDLPSESLPGPQAPPDFGLLGAGLDSRWGENENARVRRPSSVPHPGVDTRFHVSASRVLSSPLNESDYRRLLGTMSENCNQLQNSLARLNNISSFASGSDASVRCEVGELKDANAKLSTSLTSMAEEIDATKGTLKSVRSELQLVCEDKAKTEHLLHTQTLELSRLNQELINSRARESKLQSSLDEVEKAIGKAPRR